MKKRNNKDKLRDTVERLMVENNELKDRLKMATNKKTLTELFSESNGLTYTPKETASINKIGEKFLAQFTMNRDEAVEKVKALYKTTGDCANCGASDGLHHYETMQCPLHGIEETRETHKQRWANTLYKNADVIPSPSEIVDALMNYNIKDDISHKAGDSFIEWIVNDSSELGVKIFGRCFFLYKGFSLEYKEGLHDNGEPILYRRVEKREFGECCHPVKFLLNKTPMPKKYTEGDGWQTLPSKPQNIN